MLGTLVKLFDYLFTSCGVAVFVIKVTEALPLLTKEADSST